MLSVIIADDEQEVIQLCKMLIEYPVNIVAEAHDGLELLEQIELLRPDLVITDICMPGLTGIELIGKVKDTYPEINFIIMSGYTDFEYAHQALRLGVWDYLLKPLQKIELNNLLEKLDAYINHHARIQQSSENMKNNLKKSIAMLKENYLRSILQHTVQVEIPKVDGNPVFQLDGYRMQFMIFMVENQFAGYEQKSRPVEHHSELFLEQIRLYGEQQSEELTVFWDQNWYCYLLLFREDYSMEENNQFLKNIYSYLRFYNDQNRFASLSGGCSRLEEGDSRRLPELIYQAKTALSWRIEEYDNLLHVYSSKKANLSRKEPMHINEELLRNAVLGMDEEGLADATDRIWKDVYMGKLGEGILFLEAFGEALSRLWGQMNIPFEQRAFCTQVATQTKSSEQLLKNIKQSLNYIMKEYQETMAAKENSTVFKAKQYVEKNYGKEVTLHDVAKYVCLSPAYFSTIFKTETGMGFVKYLQHVRMEKAKILLRESSMSIEAIAQQVGYKDVRFFKKLFKSEINITPKEYRKFYS